MEVSGVNNTYQSTATQTASANTNANNNAAAAENDTKQNEAAVYESSKGKGKKNNTIDAKAIKAAIDEANNQGEKLRSLVEKLLTKQGDTVKKAGGFEMTKAFFENLQVDEATRKQAQEDISEDGYYGVKQTSERILNFAKALAGNDPSKIESLKKAVEKGFEEAEKAWGDKLPEISQKTHEAVMKGFDDWAASYK